MRLLETRVEQREGQTRLVGLIQAQRGQPEQLYISVAEEFGHFVTDRADAFLCALLVPCMEAGEELRSDLPVSRQLLDQLPRIQEILLCWHPGFRRIAVEAGAREGEQPRAGGVMTLFSGGVDSFYTLLRSVHAPTADVPRASHLLFVKGLEQPHHELKGVDDSIRQVAQVAQETATTLVIAETNFRDRFTLNYERMYFGSALAATAHALSRAIGTLLLPSSHSFAHLEPLGSHPLLDPLWSTGQLQVLHHGAEARRVDKTAAIVSQWPGALPRLRVCLKNAGGNYNCGRCRKCLRTMTTLDLLGALPRATGFAPRLPAEAFALLSAEDDVWLEELQQLGRERLPGSPTLKLIEAVRARHRRRLGLRLLLENTPVVASAFGAVDRWRKARWQR